MQPHVIALYCARDTWKLCLSDTNRRENDDPFDGLDVQAVEYKASVCLELHADSDW